MSIHDAFEPPYKLVFIEWTDAASPRKDRLGWISCEEAIEHCKLERILSVGWLLRNDIDSYLISPNLVSDGDCDSSTSIPKHWVLKFEVLG